MIQKEEIWNATNGGLDIFRHFIDGLPLEPKKNGLFKSPLRDEKTASAHVFRGDDGIWIYKDFGAGSGLNALDYIMNAKNVSFSEAIKMAANLSNIPVEQIKRTPPKPVVYLEPDSELVKKTLENKTSNFHAFAGSLGITTEHLECWGVGTNDKGQTAFVYFNNEMMPINIKSMTYLESGKRDKKINALSLFSKVEGEKYKLCLFGEHLLSGKPVCIVESEKTAIIASFFYPDYDWLATGGASGANKADYVGNNLNDGRQVLILLDADPVRKMPKAFDIMLSIGGRVETVDLFPERADKTDLADYIVEGLRPEIVKDKTKVFWKKSEKRDEKLEIMPTRFGRFLEENDFVKYYPEGSNDFDFCKLDGKLVDITSTKRVKDFVITYLKRPEFGDEPHDFFFNNTKFFKEDYLSGISTKSFDIKRDTKEEAFLYYQNGVVRVTAEKIEVLPYSSIGGYIWKKHVIQRDFVSGATGKGEYERFVELISGNEVKTDAFKSAIGYMIHEYRSPSKAKCVILNDMNLESEPKGGAGKGIFCKALSHVRRLAKIDAKQFDASDTFAYSGVDPTDQIVEFSDADKKMDFEKLFNVITDGFRIRRMYKDIIVLPPEKSPKIIITTNYAIKGRGGASRRRRYELEFTDHFNEDHTVEDEFGHNLFSDWDNAEWNRFDCFMAECVRFFLKNGLIKDIHKTLAAKTFEANTGTSFKEWCEMEDGPIIKVGARHFREDLIASYRAINPTHVWMQWPVMRKYLEAYCEYKGLVMKEGNTLKRWIELHQKEGYVPISDEEPDDSSDYDPNEPPF